MRLWSRKRIWLAVVGVKLSIATTEARVCSEREDYEEEGQFGEFGEMVDRREKRESRERG